ncbi:MAG TPA: hypothetical protein DER26_04160 [Verrucomicrobia bacterium]|nr:hypothetical protein [Verrucomicrobiota bacterium]
MVYGLAKFWYNTRSMLEVRRLSFSYGGQPLLRNVSFVVSPGEIVGLVGGNGAGKSTLLKLLATVFMPCAGQVLLEGRDIAGDALSYRSQVGYLPEAPAFYEDMTVKAYLKFRARLKGEPEKRIRRRMSEAAEMCCVTDVMGMPIRALSFGQKKRVALADAILLRPRILLLDDFCAGLDAGMRTMAEKMISTVASFACVVVTGHEIADMLRWSTRLLVLKDGVIADSAPVAGTDRLLLEQRMTALLRGGGA